MHVQGGMEGAATLCPHGPRQPRSGVGCPGQPEQLREGLVLHGAGTCGDMQTDVPITATIALTSMHGEEVDVRQVHCDLDIDLYVIDCDPWTHKVIFIYPKD